MQAFGMTTYSWSYGKKIREPQQIAEFLYNVGVTNYWLQAYYPSFRTSEIRFKHSNGDIESHALICPGTQRIKLPVGDKGWCGSLQFHGNHDDGFKLVDDANDVEVCARSVYLYDLH